LYGSVTGTAEAIAQRIHGELAEKLGIEANLICLADLGRKPQLEPNAVCIFVLATTGDGEAPDNANKFMRFIKRKDTPADWAAGVHYTVCGLGSTDYTNFCRPARLLDTSLPSRGANKFYDRCEADDAAGTLDEYLEPWLDGLWPALAGPLAGDTAAAAADPSTVEAAGAAPGAGSESSVPEAAAAKPLGPTCRITTEWADTVGKGAVGESAAFDAIARHQGARLALDVTAICIPPC
jgi:sulfite reductase alpha subunit-like flavoprotein